MKSIEEIKKEFQDLPGHLQEKLLDELLTDYEMRGQVLDNVNHELANNKKKKPCPYCTSEKVYKRGKQNGMQMYQCKECKKWYSESTGTPLWNIKLKHKWQGYLRCMEQGKSIKKIALEIGVCIQTSFDWRHKILSSLSEFAPKELSDEVECDELELALSKKGCKNLDRKPRKRGNDFRRNDKSEESTVVQVITAVERKGEKFFRAVESKRLSAKEISKALDGKLAGHTTLITDKHPSYRLYAKQNQNIKHKTVLAKEHVSKKDKNIHLQHVNNMHSQLRSFLLPFKGVSSKYLQNYLNWFAYAPMLLGTKATIKQWFLAILAAPLAYDLFCLFKENAVNIRL